jgi:hypothetical protein
VLKFVAYVVEQLTWAAVAVTSLPTSDQSIPTRHDLDLGPDFCGEPAGVPCNDPHRLVGGEKVFNDLGVFD